MADRLMTLAEVAEMTRTPVDTLRYWRDVDSGPPSAKLGRRVVYRESDVLAWIDEQFTGLAEPPHMMTTTWPRRVTELEGALRAAERGGLFPC